jgi:hypothetical protein
VCSISIGFPTATLYAPVSASKSSSLISRFENEQSRTYSFNRFSTDPVGLSGSLNHFSLASAGVLFLQDDLAAATAKKYRKKLN